MFSFKEKVKKATIFFPSVIITFLNKIEYLHYKFQVLIQILTLSLWRRTQIDFANLHKLRSSSTYGTNNNNRLTAVGQQQFRIVFVQYIQCWNYFRFLWKNGLKKKKKKMNK